MTNLPVADVNEVQVRTGIRSLIQLGLRGLVAMYNPERELFCHRLVRNNGELSREGLSRRYTLISLLGLQRVQDAAQAAGLDTRAILANLASDTRWLENIGDLGLLIWASAGAGPELSSQIRSAWDFDHLLHVFREARQGRTMELAWFLSGLAHLKLAGADQANLRDLAMETYGLLKKNQGENGLFSHLAEKRSFSGLMRGRVGSFADQIYSVYALAKFSQAFAVPKAAERALDCALTLCESQGPMGQWWWHYDAATGKVLGRYPVYSVHQDAMAPMALRAIGEAVDSDFRPWIYKGLNWIYGNNELEEDVRDASANVIWGGVYRNDSLRYVDSAFELLSAREDSRTHKDLVLLSECRPYQLGWLLYAWAGESLNEETATSSGQRF